MIQKAFQFRPQAHTIKIYSTFFAILVLIYAIIAKINQIMGTGKEGYKFNAKMKFF